MSQYAAPSLLREFRPFRMAGVAPLILVTLLCLGCTATRTYSESNFGGSASLTLRRDGSFEYHSVPHTIGDDCIAQGQWQRQRMDGIRYIVLRIHSEAGEGQGSCEQFHRSVLWLEYHGGVIHATGEFLPNQTIRNR
jgi:hypothetical protein